MKAILEFSLPEDQPEFNNAIKGGDWKDVCWQMDQWLRAQYKYMSDEEYSENKYNTYEKCREHLRELMLENGVKFD